MFKKHLFLTSIWWSVSILLSSCGGIEFRQITTLEYQSRTTNSETSQLNESRLDDSGVTKHPIELSETERNSIIEFIHKINQVEIDAVAQLDTSSFKDFFSGNGLQYVEGTVEDARNVQASGTTKFLEFDVYQSYYLDIYYLTPTTVSVEACEYWRIVLHDDKGDIAWLGPWSLTPIIKKIEYSESSTKVFEISEFHDGGSAFCEASSR